MSTKNDKDDLLSTMFRYNECILASVANLIAILGFFSLRIPKDMLSVLLLICGLYIFYSLYRDRKRSKAVLELMALTPKIEIENGYAMVSFKIINGLKNSIDVYPIFITYQKVDKNNVLNNYLENSTPVSIQSEPKTIGVGGSTIITMKLKMPSDMSTSLSVSAKASIRTLNGIQQLPVNMPEFIDYERCKS